MRTWQLKVGERTLSLKMLKDDAQNFRYYVLDPVLKIEFYIRELTGIKNADGTGGHVYNAMSIFTPAFHLSDEGKAARAAFIAELPETITPADVPSIKEKATAFFEKWILVKDKRETAEEHAEEMNEADKARAERDKADAEKTAAFLTQWAGDEIEIPAGSTYFEIKGHYDDSDIMTDYFHTASYGQALLLQFGRDGARREEDFRSAISHYPELTALAWTWERQEYSMGRGTWLQSGAAGETVGVTTYGHVENPNFHWEVRKYTTRQPLLMHTFKGYGQSRAAEIESEPSTASGPITVRKNDVHNGVEIVFSAKPPESVREGMKAQGFRWSGRQGLWYARFTTGRYEYAQKLAAEPVDAQ